jgi:SpoIID/LytB domain protein
VAPALRRAILASGGRVLAWQGQPIHAVYHASNGGVAAGFEESWDGAPLPYLRPQLDGPPSGTRPLALPLDQAAVTVLLGRSSGFYGFEHPSFRWRRVLDANALAAALEPGAPDLGLPSRIAVLERGASGRVMALEIRGAQPAGPQPAGPQPAGSKGATRVVLRRDAIRRTLRQLPSTLFNVEPLGAGRWRFVGGGYGHGAGLSQAGAIDLAARGWSMERILQHYYPGTQLLPLTGLSRSEP